MGLNIQNKKIILDFDVQKFNFNEIFSSYLSSIVSGDLSDLHLNLDSTMLPNNVVSENNDQQLEFYKILYKIDAGYSFNNVFKEGVFLKTYKKFINFLSMDIFKEKLIYQAKPTLRAQFPNNKAVGGWHRDRDYNHPMEEINVWVPITPAFNTNTIWLESSFDQKDFLPSDMDFGEMLIFDSGLMHGNKINKENKTRLSFDFRIIPLSKYAPSRDSENATSVAQNIKFKIGEYYSISD